MHLFANGCSFTWGGGIVEEELGQSSAMLDPPSFHSVFRYKKVWPFELHRITKSESLTNLSIGCGSNDRIVRTTLSHFIGKMNEGVDPSSHIAVIQWTEPSRFELYDPETNTWMLIKSGVVIPNVDQRRYDHLQERIAEHDATHQQNLFNSMVNISGFFDRWGIRYLFTSISPISFNDSDMMAYARDRMNWFGGIDSSLTTITTDPVLRYKSTHPNPAGHARIADLLYDQIKSLGWI